MSFWDEYSIRWAWVCCFFLLLISLISQSWIIFGVTVAVFLSSTVDTWMWWLPGMSRRERYRIPLEGGAELRLRRESPDAWIAQTVRTFRNLGFFASDRDLSDEAIARRIAASAPFDATRPGAEFNVLVADRDRIWIPHPDLEATGEKLVYTSLLEEWGRISGGAFQPREISELWESDFGPILLEFTLDRQRHMVEAEYLDGDIDTSILGQINELIEDSGRQFEVISTADRKWFLVFVTPEERLRLASRFGR